MIAQPHSICNTFFPLSSLPQKHKHYNVLQYPYLPQQEQECKYKFHFYSLTIIIIISNNMRDDDDAQFFESVRPIKCCIPVFENIGMFRTCFDDIRATLHLNMAFVFFAMHIWFYHSSSIFTSLTYVFILIFPFFLQYICYFG